MNSELSFIHSQTHSQELLRAAQHEHRLDAAESRTRPSDRRRTTVSLRTNRGWRVLDIRRAAVGKV